MGKTYQYLMHDSMRRNSSLLILSQLANAVCVFAFWVICAHLFKAGTVGLATAFISFGLLVATFTNLGLPNTVIRFLPASKRRGGLFTASISLVAVASLIGAAIALLLVKILVPRLGFIQASIPLSIILVFLVSGTAISNLLDGTLMAYRKGEYILSKALLTNLPRIILPFLVISSGIKGITGIYVVMLLVGISYTLFITIKKLLKSENLRPTLGEVKKHKIYAASNYFGGMFGVLPSTVVPIIVLSRLGSEPAAYFYMPMQIAAFLSVVCSSTSQALIAECSQTESETEQKKFFRKAFIHQYRILIPVVLLLYLGAWPILRIYGRAYVEHGFWPLIILTTSSLIVGINWLGDTWLNIKKRTRDYFLMNAFNAVIVVGFVYFFAIHGLVAIGLGWLTGQVISAVVYTVIFARSQLLGFVGTLKVS